MSSLHIASERGHVSVVEKLLKEGANVNCTDKVSFAWCRLCQILFNQENNLTPLMCAALGCHELIVELLLAHRADLDTVTSSGYTALNFASVHGQQDLIDLLQRPSQQMFSDSDYPQPGTPCFVVALP